METYRTEEEQVEALRRWWDENGRSTLAAIALALVAGFGWQGWQQYQQEQSEAASVVYESLLEASQLDADDAQLSTIRHLAETIKTDYPGTSYAGFAALHLARLAVVENDLPAAESELRWLLTSGPDSNVELLAQLRLARVLAAQGNLLPALEILNSVEPGAYESAYAEARGDIHLQLGEPDPAREAYQLAAAAAAASGVGASQALQLKLQSLNLQQPRAVSVATAALVEESIVTDGSGVDNAAAAGE